MRYCCFIPTIYKKKAATPQNCFEINNYNYIYHHMIPERKSLKRKCNSQLEKPIYASE